MNSKFLQITEARLVIGAILSIGSVVASGGICVVLSAYDLIWPMLGHSPVLAPMIFIYFPWVLVMGGLIYLGSATGGYQFLYGFLIASVLSLPLGLFFFLLIYLVGMRGIRG